MEIRARILALSGTVLVATACVSTPVLEEDASARWREIADTLERDATPDDLLAAALIRTVALDDAKRGLESADRAVALEPRRPEAVWVALSLCAQVPECQTQSREKVLAGLDPGNAVAHYHALTAARQTGDGEKEDEALTAMAHSDYFDLYWSRLITRATDSLIRPRGESQRPLHEIQGAGVNVTGWLGAVAIPAFTSVSDTCKGERLVRQVVVQACRRLASVLDRGDTYITQAFGQSLAKRVWPEDSAEAARFRAHARERHYVLEMSRDLEKSLEDSPDQTRRWLDRHRSRRTESEVYRQWLLDEGLSPDPPAEWVPKSAGT